MTMLLLSHGDASGSLMRKSREPLAVTKTMISMRVYFTRSGCGLRNWNSGRGLSPTPSQIIENRIVVLAAISAIS